MKKKHFLFEIILKDIAACNSDVKNGICNKKLETPCHWEVDHPVFIPPGWLYVEIMIEIISSLHYQEIWPRPP